MYFESVIKFVFFIEFSVKNLNFLKMGWWILWACFLKSAQSCDKAKKTLLCSESYVSSPIIYLAENSFQYDKNDVIYTLMA